jgi:TPR repeat protein
VVGAQIGKYRVTARIAEGGCGEVWSAKHVEIGHCVAIKLLLANVSGDEAMVERLFREARAVSRIEHPGIVQIFDCGRHDGRAYLVMELLHGESLGTRVARERSLPADAAISIVRQVAFAVGAAHARGVLHRDLKPDNVFLVADPGAPEGFRVKVLDFGIARLVDEARRTVAGGILGSPEYMAPEHWNDAHTVDGRADIYALGCTLFELLEGTPPYPLTARGWAAVMNAHTSSPVPQLGASVPPKLARLCRSMMAKDLADRPATPEAVVAELDLLRAPRTEPPKARSRRAMMLGIVGACAIAGGGAALIARRDAASSPVAPIAPDAALSVDGPPRASGATVVKQARLVRAALVPADTDTPAAIERLRAACDRGEPLACDDLAWLYRAGEPRDPERAAGLERTACRDGAAASCFRIASATLRAKDDTGATSMLERACSLEHADACHVLAWKQLRGGDPARARPLLAKACAAGSAVACERRAWVHELGLGGSPDPDEAGRMFARACRLGGFDACLVLWSRGLTSEDDDAEQQRCVEADGLACRVVGMRFLFGIGTRKFPDAGRWLALGCTFGDATACDHLGTVHAIGATDERAPPREVACELGAHSACHFIASHARDQAMLERLCAAGHPASCYAASRNHYYGTGVTKDVDRAERGFRSICELGSMRACTALAVITIHDRKRPTDGEPQLTRACGYGEPLACHQLAVAQLARGDEARGLASLESAKKLGSPEACLELAERSSDLAKRRELERDAFRRFRAACITEEDDHVCKAAAELGGKLGVEADVLGHVEKMRASLARRAVP